MGRPLLLPVLLFAIILIVVGVIIMAPVDDTENDTNEISSALNESSEVDRNQEDDPTANNENSNIFNEPNQDDHQLDSNSEDDPSVDDLLIDNPNTTGSSGSDSVQEQSNANNLPSILSQISGVVQNSMHEPISAVTVSLDDGQLITTSEDGRFLFQELEQMPYTLQVSASGYRPLTRSAIDAGTNNMVIVLVRDGVLQGEVIDNTNQSVAFANISVKALEGIYLQELRADAEGRFVLENPPDRRLSLNASQEGFSNEGEGNRIAEPPFAEHIVLRLNQPSFSISGMVLNQETGQGVSDFHIVANLDDGSLPEPLHAQSAGGGLYRFDNLKPGKYSVSSDAKQNERLNLVVPVDQDFKTVKVLERDATNVNFQVVSGMTVSGIVQTQNGSPVGGAEVKVAKIPSAQTLSSFDGRFVLKSVPILSLSGNPTPGMGEIRLMASHHEYGSGTSDPIPQGTNTPINNVVINLQGFATLSGFVVDQDELPVFNARISLLDLTTGIQVEQISQPDGSFVFEEISVAQGVANEFAGTHQISVNHELYSPLQKALTLTSNQDTNIQLQLLGGSQISGQVTDTDGNPVPGVIVRTQLPQGGQAVAVSEVNGSYQFPSLPAGQYDLRFRLDTNPPLTATLYGVRAGTSGANAVLEAWEWRVTGTITDSLTGQPVTNYTINIQGRPTAAGAGRYMQSEVVNTHNGTYQRAVYEPGEYFLTFTKPGYENKVTKVRFDLGYREIQYINETMTPADQFGGVRGIFNPPPNTRLYGITVLGVKNYIATSNAFEITDLPAGNQSLLFYIVENNGASAPLDVGVIPNFVVQPNEINSLGTIGPDILRPLIQF